MPVRDDAGGLIYIFYARAPERNFFRPNQNLRSILPLTRPARACASRSSGRRQFAGRGRGDAARPRASSFHARAQLAAPPPRRSGIATRRPPWRAPRRRGRARPPLQRSRSPEASISRRIERASAPRAARLRPPGGPRPRGAPRAPATAGWRGATRRGGAEGSPPRRASAARSRAPPSLANAVGSGSGSSDGGGFRGTMLVTLRAAAGKCVAAAPA